MLFKKMREDDILPYEKMAGLFQTRPKQSFMPPSGREGDREAGEGARGHKSREYDIIAGGYGIRPYGIGVMSASAKEPKASYTS